MSDDLIKVLYRHYISELGKRSLVEISKEIQGKMLSIAYEISDNNVTKTAKLLKLNRSTTHQYLVQHRIKKLN